ncbi:tail fiber protein [Neotamlana laminarinivorans]|uniref:Tail fiber protein n=1 Tax=Neotamlana laminarinivorans TaxID=2883124 RepID=A0A9X1HWV6_9FLAO|nr:tail fiber protein [Tamlana laminarinivorans]MCB4797236.1 tail fiber protein [Tamlana laminarinivorans]
MKKFIILLIMICCKMVFTQTTVIPIQDNNLEGGELLLMNSNSNYNKWRIDNYAGNLRFFHDGKTYFFLNSSGNLGIGAYNPLALLHVNSSTPNSELIRLDNNGLRRTSILNYSDGTTDNAGLQFKKESTVGQFKFSNLNGDLLTILSNGNVGIGTTLSSNPNNYKLAVKGTIGAQEVKVENSSLTWSDFVFHDNYNLPSLKEVEQHIKEKGHLKDIPSAKDVEQNGIFLGEMDAKLLQKIEELTLYIIEQEKQLQKQSSEINELKSLVDKLLNLKSE